MTISGEKPAVRFSPRKYVIPCQNHQCFWLAQQVRSKAEEASGDPVGNGWSRCR